MKVPLIRRTNFIISASVIALSLVIFIGAANNNGKASTPTSSTEAENGTLTGGTLSTVGDNSASGDSAVKFGDGGTTVWTGNFESGDLSGWINQSCPGGVSVVTSPVRDGSYAAKFTVDDQSTHSNCPDVPTESPRAQLISSPYLFGDGDEYYIGFSTYFPEDFPTIPGWLQFAEIYGKPWGGTPSMGFIVDGTHLAFNRDPTHNKDEPWISSDPLVKGTWEDIVVHVKFSDDPSVGFVELWLNGVKQTFNNGSTRIYYDTLVSGINWDGSSKNQLYLNQYRGAAPLGTVTLYHDAAKVGTTYDSVLP